MRIGGDGAEISHALSGARRVREEIEREREDAREVPSPAKAARPHADGRRAHLSERPRASS